MGGGPTGAAPLGSRGSAERPMAAIRLRESHPVDARLGDPIGLLLGTGRLNEGPDPLATPAGKTGRQLDQPIAPRPRDTPERERQGLPPLCRICRAGARIAIPGIASGCARRRSPGRSWGTMCGTAIRVKALTRAAPRSGPPLNRPAGIFGRLGSRAVSQRRQHSAHRQRDAEAGCRVSFRALARALGTTSAAAQSGWEIPV